MVAVAATVSAAAKAAVALLVQYSGMATIRGSQRGAKGAQVLPTFKNAKASVLSAHAQLRSALVVLDGVQDTVSWDLQA